MIPTLLIQTEKPTHLGSQSFRTPAASCDKSPSVAVCSNLESSGGISICSRQVFAAIVRVLPCPAAIRPALAKLSAPCVISAHQPSIRSSARCLLVTAARFMQHLSCTVLLCIARNGAQFHCASTYSHSFPPLRRPGATYLALFSTDSIF